VGCGRVSVITRGPTTVAFEPLLLIDMLSAASRQQWMVQQARRLRGTIRMLKVP